MKKPKRRLLALQIAAPALILFGLSLYYYIQHYHFLYSKALLGPVATLSLVVFGAYALTLYPKILLLLKTKSPTELKQLNWIKTLLFYLPIALLVLAFVAGWLYFTRVTMQWAAGKYFPGLEGLLFLLAFLMLGQEVMKYLGRKSGLNTYLVSKEPKQPQLKLSRQLLQLLVVAQSLGFLLLTWLGFILATLLLTHLGERGLSNYWLILSVIIAYTPIILGAIQLEKRLEKWARDHLYIPWNSN